MVAGSAFIVCAVSTNYCYLHAEELFLEKQLVTEMAFDAGKRLEVELVRVEHTLTLKQQRRRSRLLSLVQRGKFDRLVFRGDSFTPYLGALRKAAYPRTEVINKSEQNSTLDFYLQMFEYERGQGVLR